MRITDTRFDNFTMSNICMDYLFLYKVAESSVIRVFHEQLYIQYTLTVIPIDMDPSAANQNPKTPDNIVAVVCVVESSLTLASEWSRVLVEYVSPLFKRLHDAYAGHQVRSFNHHFIVSYTVHSYK
jgi:hypothetical protein